MGYQVIRRSVEMKSGDRAIRNEMGNKVRGLIYSLKGAIA